MATVELTSCGVGAGCTICSAIQSFGYIEIAEFIVHDTRAICGVHDTTRISQVPVAVCSIHALYTLICHDTNTIPVVNASALVCIIHQGAEDPAIASR
ncbi:hypothetical protein D3C86_1378090 [compost metagenome]